MTDALKWLPTCAWGPFATSGRGGASYGDAGVRIELGNATTMLSIVARAGRREALARTVADGFGATLPKSGRLVAGCGGDLVWTGPDHWLAITSAAIPAALRHDLEGAAAVTDQSSARALLHVSGPDAREALAKGFAIDLHPDVFAPGHAAATSVAHIAVQIWQRDAGRYTIAVPPSFAASFWSWLVGASAAYGYEVAA